MRKFNKVILSIVFLILLASPALASTIFNVEFQAADNLNVSGFTIWFTVANDFSFSNLNLGNAVPTEGILGWDMDSNAIALDPQRGRVFKIGAYDQDGLFLSSPQYLKNGTLFSFEYEGSPPELSDIVQFDPGDGSNLYPDSIVLASFNETGAVFAAVPIPSTLLLLGGGLLGLMGIRRRKKA